VDGGLSGAGKQALDAMNPLCTLRYSATHANKHHMVYRLDAVDAYERKLVKQIEVAAATVESAHNRPVVRLVSDPEMPDGEKLSWLILGHPSEQQGGNEAALLLAAAHSLLGGQDGGPLKSIQRELGIDEFAIVSGTLGGSGRRQTSRIAGSSFVADDTASGQIVSIGKRLATNMQLSYEQALTGAGSAARLTVNLSRNLSLIGRAGSENALDLLWNYRFGR
jgi:translocation and assembly module TamB